jgi:hypothetical protein
VSKRGFVAALGLALGLHPGSLLACAACYGQSDSPMAAGMNWGILSLLGVILMVLGGVAASFVSMARRAAAVAAASAGSPNPMTPPEGLARDPLAPAGGRELVHN